MSFFVNAFNVILYVPLFNALIFLYNTVALGDLGVAIIILTVLIRFFLYPLSRRAIQSQKELKAIQPEVKKIQEKYKGDKEKQAKQMLALYRDRKINPASGCLPILIQLPVLLALFRVFYTGLDSSQLSNLYSFIYRPDSLNVIFLGLVDLSERSVVLALTAGILQFIQSKMMMPKVSSKKKTDISSIMSQQMVYMMPLVTVVIALSLPAALPLYWTAITLFGIVQQHLTPRLSQGTVNS